MSYNHIMNDAEIAALKAAFSKGTVMWQPYDTAPALKVESIGPAPKPTHRSDVPEPSEVAYLAGRDTGYVALYNCELRDFIIANRIKVI